MNPRQDGPARPARQSPAPSPVQAFVDYFRHMDPQQKGFVYQQVKREMGDAAAVYDDDEASPLTDRIRPAARSVLQVHNSYLITQDEHGIVIVDQHALHERVMFQKLLQRISRAGRLEAQRLLTPATLPAAPRRLDALDRIRPLLETIGVEAAPLGPGTIAVHSFPTLLFDRGVEPAAFLSDLLDRADDADFEPTSEAALHETLDLMSCKAAVKAGDPLDPDEVLALLGQKDTTERSASCPHGRPTAVRLTLRDLEKHFKRG